MPVVPSIPRDIGDHIIDTVYSSGDSETLDALSVVSQAWRLPSQAKIFKKFYLDFKKMKLIHSEISSTTNPAASRQRLLTLLSYVRDLEVDALKLSSPESHGAYPEILKLFTNVTSLQLNNWYFQEFNSGDICDFFGHFGQTVTTLQLFESFSNSGVLVSLTSLFFRIRSLSVSPRTDADRKTYRPQVIYEDSPVEFGENLQFSYLKAQDDPFLEFVNDRCSDVRAVSLYRCESVKGLQKLLERQGERLASVTIGFKPGEFTAVQHGLRSRSTSLGFSISLKPCIQLKHLSIRLNGSFQPDDPSWQALRTLASPVLEVISVRDFYPERLVVHANEWAEVDFLLCECYDRSNPNGVGTFRVVFHLDDLDSDSEEVRNMLREGAERVWPEFSRKSRVTFDPPSPL